MATVPKPSVAAPSERQRPPHLVLPPKKRVSWDAELAREEARIKRQREGGQHADLAERRETEHLHEHPQRDLTQQQATPFFPEYEVMVQDLLEGTTEKTHVEAKHCPFHSCILDIRVSKTSWMYYRCPVQNCPMFCAADDVDQWLQGLKHQLHDSYKEQPDQDLTVSLPYICYCVHENYHQLKLGKSRSDKNPGRFYLMCKHKRPQGPAGCNFFQWLDTPLLSHNARAWYPPQPPAHLHPLGC